MRALEEEEEEEVVVPSCLLEGQQVWTREEEEEDSDLKRHRRRAATRAALAQVAELLFLWEVRVVRLHLTGRLRLAAMAHRHLDPTRRLAEARALEEVLRRRILEAATPQWVWVVAVRQMPGQAAHASPLDETGADDNHKAAKFFGKRL